MAVLQSGPVAVLAGSRMDWTGQFPDWLNRDVTADTPGEAVIAVGAYLRNNYDLIVEKADNAISWGGIGGGSITLHLRTNMDRGDGQYDDGLTDILGNVNEAFAQRGLPVTGAVINTYRPARGPAQNTGADSALPPADPDNPGEATGYSWWDKLTDKVEAGSIGFILGGIAVIGLIVFVAVKSEV